MDIIVKLKNKIMENLTLLIVGIILVPVIIGGLIFALNDRDPESQHELESSKPLHPVSVWPRDYVRMYYNGIYGTIKNAELEEIFKKLRKVNKAKPKDRKKDKYDAWYESNIKNFCRYGEVLAYIAIYGNLTDRFIAGLKNPQYDVELQRHLVSVYQNQYDHCYHLNCQSLLWYYLEHWDLLPEIKRVILKDARFEAVLDMYKRRRGDVWV